MAAAGVGQPVLKAKLRAAGDGRTPFGEHLGSVVRVRAHPERIPQLLRQRAAGESQPALVYERHIALGVGHPHERRRGVGQLAKARLAVADQLLVSGPFRRCAKDVRERLEEIGVVRAEVLRRAAVRAEHAEEPLARPDRRSHRADDRKIALEGRRAEARLGREVVDHDGALGVEGETGKLLLARVKRSPKHAVG